MRSQTVHFWRDEILDEVELLHGSFTDHQFPMHYHDGFGFGVIEEGALGFRYRGENIVASKGMINLVNPDEMHNGHDIDKMGWQYRMFYLPPTILQEFYSQMSGNEKEIPFFPMGVLHDPDIARRMLTFHKALEQNSLSRLEKEQEFYTIMHLLLYRHADKQIIELNIGNETERLQRILNLINDTPQKQFSIDELATEAGLTPWHFIRVFKNEMGLTPHAYLTQVRVHYAARLLQCGYSISEVAELSGFTDQSHLHRNFRKIFAVTPGQYRNFVQE